jgi:hypothetical protein
MAAHYTRTHDHRAGRGAAELLNRMAGFGIEPPAEIAEMLARTSALRARLKAAPLDVNHRRDALVALLDDPQADVSQHVAGEVSAAVYGNVLMQSVDESVRATAEAVVRLHDEILASIRSALFDPSLQTLTAAAAIEPGVSVSALMRARRNDEARALADAEAAAESIAAAYSLRLRLYGGARSGLDNLECCRWLDPAVVDGHLGDLRGADRWLAGIRAGGQLWLGTMPEVEDASRAYRARLAGDDYPRPPHAPPVPPAAQETPQAPEDAPQRPKATPSGVVAGG